MLPISSVLGLSGLIFSKTKKNILVPGDIHIKKKKVLVCKLCFLNRESLSLKQWVLLVNNQEELSMKTLKLILKGERTFMSKLARETKEGEKELGDLEEQPKNSVQEPCYEGTDYCFLKI